MSSIYNIILFKNETLRLFLLKKTNTHGNCFAVIIAIVLEWNTNKEDGNYKSPGLKFIYMVLSDKLQEKPFFDLNQQITPILPK